MVSALNVARPLIVREDRESARERPASRVLGERKRDRNVLDAALPPGAVVS